MTAQFQPTTFRFKFTPEFQNELNAFAQLHRFDNRHDFKDAWEKWTHDHSALIDNESKKLKGQGYEGSPTDKMYKSARYYFRKKPTTKDEPKKRRKYVSLDSSMISLMDDHIVESSRRADFKPAIAFDNFCDNFRTEITNEITRLYTLKSLSEKEISEKFKKTYKNRYFQTIKSQC